jgi:hypothetical protein
LVRWLVVLAVVACGNRSATPVPRGRPLVELVRCAPATPPPQAADTAAEVEVSTVRTAGSFGSRAPLGRIVVKGTPTLTFGPGSVEGAITRDELAAVARANHAGLMICFRGESPGLARAAVQYTMDVGTDGRVFNVKTSSSSLSSVLDTCIRRTLRIAQFPAKPASSKVILPLIYDTTGAFGAPDPEEPAIEPDAWTPYAIGTTPPTPTATGAARATEAAVRQRLGAIDSCFATPGPSGSLRILVELDISGDLASVRAGGIGDKAAEVCAAKALAGLHVMTPAQEHVEVACDLARGDAQPWRVSPAAGYQLIEVDGRGLKHGADFVVPGTSEAEPLPADTYVVLAKPDTLGGMLQFALMWARDATAVMFAVADGKSPPLFLGMGNATAAEEVDVESLRPAVRVGSKQVTGCVGRASHTAAVTDGVAIGGLLLRLAARCRTLRCAPTLVVAIDSDTLARDLLEVAGAARRAGFDRVLFGGSELGCSADSKAKKPALDGDSE